MNCSRAYKYLTFPSVSFSFSFTSGLECFNIDVTQNPPLIAQPGRSTPVKDGNVTGKDFKENKEWTIRFNQEVGNINIIKAASYSVMQVRIRFRLKVHPARAFMGKGKESG